MSNVMLLGVLKMPIDMWSNDPLNESQRHARYVEAAYKIEKYEELLDELWLMGKNLISEKEQRDLGQNMCNRIREFSKENL